jgi:hypothetical protein
MAAEYPSVIPTTASMIPHGTTLNSPKHSDMHDKVSAEVVAITTELGVNARGASATVSSRIAAVESGGGGNVTGAANSTSGTIVVMNGTSGKLIAQATGTGLVKMATGVLSAATTADYVATTMGTAAGQLIVFTNSGVAGVVTAPGTNGYILTADTTNAAKMTWAVAAAGTGAGDVTGAANSTTGTVVLMNGTSGKVIQQATLTGLLKATTGVLAAATTADYIQTTIGTAAGSILTFSGSGVASTLAAAGTTGYLLSADTTNAAKMVWTAPVFVTKAVGTAAGDLLYFSASATPAALPVAGTTGYVLTADTTAGAKMKWAAAATGGTAAGASVTRATFGSAALSTAGVLTITHNLGLSAPYPVVVSIFGDGTVGMIIPDSIVGSTNSVAVGLASFSITAGTLGYAIVAG